MNKKFRNFSSRSTTTCKSSEKVCKIEGRFWCIFILFYFKITRDFSYMFEACKASLVLVDLPVGKKIVQVVTATRDNQKRKKIGFFIHW